jgi:hypothetical protein
VTITSVNTFYDGPSLASLPAGTYLFTGSISVKMNNGSGEAITAKLWDGTTVFASAYSEETGTNFHNQIPLTAIVTLTGTTTVKISVALAAAGGAIRATAPLNNAGATGTVSTLTATKVA